VLQRDFKKCPIQLQLMLQLGCEQHELLVAASADYSSWFKVVWCDLPCTVHRRAFTAFEKTPITP
jgi:hypothetical protein